ncbi:MAG: GGDEF domain-containing protein [Colwellia sp.]|nr:GGDEF domain-containing protein [Colwellia sp.]
MGVTNKPEQLLTKYNDASGFLFSGSKSTLYFILATTYLLFLTLAIKNYYLGYTPLAAMLLIFVCLAIIDTNALYKGLILPININIVISTLVLTLILTIYCLGVSASVWAYPISIALIYLLPKKSSTIFNFIIFSFVSVFYFLNVDVITASRASFSLFITILFSNLIASHIHKLNQDLIYESVRDPMTGALNRRQLSAYLDTSLANKKRNNINSAILMFDIDHFKNINDTFGHDVGDAVIKKLVDTINKHSRELDILFRFGGEEFILLVQDIDILIIHEVAENLRKRITKECIINNHPVTVSIGISTLHSILSTDMWIKHADTALYKAKNSGRNQVQMYTS